MLSASHPRRPIPIMGDMATEDRVHVDWIVDDLDVFVCTKCALGHVRKRLEPVPLTHHCGGSWGCVTDPNAKRAMLKILTRRLFKADLDEVASKWSEK